MNIYFINTDTIQQKNSKTELCRLYRKAQKALTTVKGKNGNGKKGN